MGYTDIDKQLLALSLKSEHLPKTLCENAANFVLSCQDRQGGFLGIDAQPSIHQCLFAVHVLSLTGFLKGELAERIADYLLNEITTIHALVMEKESRRDGPLDFLATDFFAQIISANLLRLSSGIDVFQESHVDKREAVERGIRSLLQEDCGIATSPKSHHSGLYYTALAVSVMQLSGIPLTRLHSRGIDALCRLIRDRQGPNGGYYDFDYDTVCDIRATSAAVRLARNLAIERTFFGLDAADDPEQSFVERVIDRRATVHFLNKRRAADGGYRSDRNTAESDIRSTFFAVLAFCNFADWQFVDFSERDRTIEFIFSLQRENGGFGHRLGLRETTPESTYYGLAALAMLR